MLFKEAIDPGTLELLIELQETEQLKDFYRRRNIISPTNWAP